MVIPDLPGEITTLSADGSVVAGTTVDKLSAWRFKHGVGISYLDIPGASQVIPRYDAQSISANGSIVVGTAVFAGGVKQAFLWDVEADTHVLLPEGPAPEALRLQGAGTPPGVWTVIPEEPIISADGLVVVGSGRAVKTVNGSPSTSIASWPFRWTAANGTSDSPQAPFAFQVFVQGFSGDGSTIIAKTDSGPGLVPHSVRNRNGIAETVNAATSRPTALSNNGQRIWGTLSASPYNPFLWNNPTQGPVVVSLPRFVARSVSDDAKIIAGVRRDFPVAFTDEPWVYDTTGNFPASDRSLKDFLTNNPFGYGFSTPSDLLFPTTFIRYALADRSGQTFAAVGTKRVNRVPPLQFVGLGDSYSSGEGVPLQGNFDNPGPFENGTYVIGGNQCHRSFKAFPADAKPRSSWRSFKHFKIDGAEVPGWEYAHVACSGAVTAHVTAGIDPLVTGGQYNAPYQGLSVNSQTDLITITIGGNDAHFKALLESCAGFGLCRSEAATPNPTLPWQTYLPRFIRNDLKGRLTTVYTDLKTRAPNATIIVLGYPILFSDAMECEGAGLVELLFSMEERQFFNQMTRKVNETIESTAAEVGVHYVDLTRPFRRHDVCAGSDSWVRPVDPTVDPDFWFHPTLEGQLAMSKEVNRFLEGADLSSEYIFSTVGMPSNPAPVTP